MGLLTALNLGWSIIFGCTWRAAYKCTGTYNPELKVFMISIFWLIILSWFAQIVVGIILLWKKKILNAKLKKLKRPVEIGEISSHGGIGRHT